MARAAAAAFRVNLFGTMVGTGKFATFEAGSAFLVGYTSAEHDATVVAWKEKVRHDLVRPTTFIRHRDETHKELFYISYA